MSCAAVAILAACNQPAQKKGTNDEETAVDVNSSPDAGQLGTIEFEETAYDFGTVKEGAIVDHVFKFKNSGDAPVILSQVSASCGCTTPDYTKEPILPGKEGEIKVSFNSQGQVGQQQKIVTISSNASNKVTTVQIKGTVEK